MTTQTLFSNASQSENLAGPFVPAATVINAGNPVTRADFTLTVSPNSGWCEVSLLWGPDGVNFPGQASIYCAPGAGSTTQGMRFHYSNPPQGGLDAAQYFKAEPINVSSGAAASLTVTY